MHTHHTPLATYIRTAIEGALTLLVAAGIEEWGKVCIYECEYDCECKDEPAGWTTVVAAAAPTCGANSSGVFVCVSARGSTRV